MLEYLRKRQGEAKAQETEKEQAAVPAGAGNQAMLSMLKAQGERGEVQPASGGTPLAEAMRAKFERHFGLPMDDVRVHRNSDEPAKFDAGAYTYGTDIFIGPGQENLLSHEMTHVAQQKLGQVRPTGMEHGMAVNRSPALEHSADLGTVSQAAGSVAGPVVQCGGSHSRAKSEDSKKKGKRRKEQTAIDESTQPLSKRPRIATTATSPPMPEPMETTTTTTTIVPRPMSMPKETTAAVTPEEQMPMPTEAAAATRFHAPAAAAAAAAEVPAAALDPGQFFTSENFRGASISDGKVGSIYFGGTSFDEIGEKSQPVINTAVRNYLENKNETTRKALFDALKKAGIKSGGRIRFVHNSGPEISKHQHVLRMKDPRENKEGRLLEIFFDESTDDHGTKWTLHTHPSRGVLIPFSKGAAGGESVPASKEAEDERKKIVQNIGSLPDEVFLRLATVAKAAQTHVAQAAKPQKKEAAKEANQKFIATLGSDLVGKIGTRTQADLDEENRQKELQRKNPKGK